MKTAGIDIGTTTISGVVLEKGRNGQAKILEAKTVENGCFIETGNDWERIQDARKIVEKAVNLLDYFLEKYPTSAPSYFPLFVTWIVAVIVSFCFMVGVFSTISPYWKVVYDRP